MRLGLYLTSMIQGSPLRDILDVGRVAEDVGFDERTTAGVEAVHEVIDAADLYARTGLQFLPFNTIYQLAAARGSAAFAAARTVLLIPDLIGYWLSGVRLTEVTNASTTALLDVHRRTWDRDLMATLAISPGSPYPCAIE